MATQNIAVLSLPHQLTGTVTAQRFVTVAGTQAAADVNALGVARTGGGNGDLVTVDVLGTAIVEAGAGITKGDTLKVDNSGRAIKWVTSGAKVAIALEAATGAGAFLEVLLIPNVA